jgi:hypothetical protein
LYAVARCLSACIRCQTSPIVGRFNSGSGRFGKAASGRRLGRSSNISSSEVNCEPDGSAEISAETGAGRSPNISSSGVNSGFGRRRLFSDGGGFGGDAFRLLFHSMAA